METYDVEVNYSVPLSTALQQARLTAVAPNITPRNFPPPDRGIQPRKLQIHQLEHSWVARDVSVELARRRQDPANLYDLLELLRRFELPPGVLVALGSRWFYPIGSNYCPFVHLGPHFRELRLARIEKPFGPQCGFLAALKETS